MSAVICDSLDYLIVNFRESFKTHVSIKSGKIKRPGSRVFQTMVVIIVLSKGEGYLYILIFKVCYYEKVKTLIKTKQH